MRARAIVLKTMTLLFFLCYTWNCAQKIVRARNIKCESVCLRHNIQDQWRVCLCKACYSGRWVFVRLVPTSCLWDTPIKVQIACMLWHFHANIHDCICIKILCNLLLPPRAATQVLLTISHFHFLFRHLCGDPFISQLPHKQVTVQILSAEIPRIAMVLLNESH